MTTEELKKKYAHLWNGDIIQGGDWVEYVQFYDIHEIIENEIKENNDHHSKALSNKLKPNQTVIDKDYLKEIQDFYNNYK